MIIITNPGKLDLNGLRLFGASSKRGESGKIGFFGSGAKYALSWLLRNEVFFQLWIDGEEIPITTKKVSMRDTEYDEIIINGIDASITTQTGPKWQAWMCIRELYANALDEGGEMAVTDNYLEFIKAGRTTFIIEENALFKELLENQDYYFARNRKVIYENDRIKIYDKHRKGAGLYLNGILVSETIIDNKDGLGYQLKLNPFLINEERSVFNRDEALSMTIGGIMTIENDELVDSIVGLVKSKKLNEGSFTFERELFVGYRISSQMEIGASPQAREQFDNGRRYTACPGYPGSDWVSKSWRRYKAYPGQEEEKFSKMRFSVLMSEQISACFGIEKLEDTKWQMYNDAEMIQKMNDSYIRLRKLMPELSAEMEEQCPFSLGTTIDPNMSIERWKSKSWINYTTALTDSSHELMVKMFTYIMIDSGAHGQKIAALMLMDRIRQQTKTQA